MRLIAAILLALLSTATSFAQCEIPKSQFEQAPNIFTPEQEGYLGDVFAERIARSLHLIDDADVNSYPNQLAQRLLKNVPPTFYNFRIQLMDQPYTNAFATPGGRIYVARKAALLAKNEDELAGLLAHEMSHIYTRQLGADYTRMFHDVLGVNSAGDRADVTRKYHLLLDTWRKKKFTVESKHDEQEQVVADQTAIYMMARAGYRSAAFREYYDRLAETKGKTGGFWSGFFGTTPPESKRLRAILDDLATLPASCITQTRPPEQEFTQWKQKLLEWSSPSLKNSVRYVVLQTKLDPPLLGDIDRLRFSPDGKYILAQDDSTASVLTRQPFAFLFRVALPTEPLPATFSPDSRFLITASETGRVERWDLISFKRVSVSELSMAKECVQTKLSPDGKTLACYRFDALQLIDTSNANVIFEKKNFYKPFILTIYLASLEYAALGVSPEYVELDFSPDGHYFAASSSGGVIALDMTTKLPLELHGGIKGGMEYWFTFAGNDRILMRKASDNNAYVVEFPTGKGLYKFAVGPWQPRPVTNGDMIIVPTLQDHPTGIYDLAAGKFDGGVSSAALDIYGRQHVREIKSGMLMLADNGGTWTANSHSVQLPEPQLGNARVLSVSDDLHWLAVSQRSRGAVFDLKSGARKGYFRHFNGAWISSDEHLWADFPKVEETDRIVLCFDVTNQNVASKRKIDKDVLGYQRGPYFVRTRQGRSADIAEVHDVKTDSVLWVRDLRDNPGFSIDPVAGTVVLRWPASALAAKEAAHVDSSLAAKLSQIKDRDKSYYLEVLEAQSGKSLGHLLIDTGKRSFYIQDVQATANYVAVKDSEERVRLYSLTNGEEPAVMFSKAFDLSRAGMLLLQNDEHHIQVFDAKTSESIDEYGFESPIALARFIGDGTRLVVLTRDQTAFVLKPQSHNADTIQAAAK